MKFSRPIVFSGTLLSLFFIHETALAGLTYTNETIQQMLKDNAAQKSHGVMAEQRQRLAEISDGFLIGDGELIQKKADEISEAMQETVSSFPPSHENSADVWTAMSNIVEESRLLKIEAANKNYFKAYEHYTKIESSCIQCHQVARSWGKLDMPVVKAEPEKVPAPSVLVKESPPQDSAAAVAELENAANKFEDGKKEKAPVPAADDSNEIPFGRLYSRKDRPKESN